MNCEAMWNSEQSFSYVALKYHQLKAKSKYNFNQTIIQLNINWYLIDTLSSKNRPHTFHKYYVNFDLSNKYLQYFFW